MKTLFGVLAILCLLTGCAGYREVEPIGNSGVSQIRTKTQSEAVESEKSKNAETPAPESSQVQPTPEEEQTMTVMVTVGTQAFTAELYENETARAFAALLPLELDMTELNGNEKFFYFDSALPTDAARPDEIHTGDLMLYGSECIVLFYESFSTPYSYTPIGRVQNPEGLAEALGSGNVTVTFKTQ